MKIQNLSVKGFRSLANIEWTPGDLNLLIGPNASGKSNLLRALELLSDSARGELEKYVQREGGMEPLVWDGSAERIAIEIAEAPTDGAILRRYLLQVVRLGKASGYRIRYESLIGKKADEPVTMLERTHSRAVVLDPFAAKNEFIAAEGSVSDVETFLSMASGPFAKNEWVRETQEDLAAWAIYKHLDTSSDAVIRLPAVSSFSKRLEPDAHNLVSVLHTLYTTDRDFEQELDSAMKAAFGDEFQKLVFPPDADQRVQLRVRWKSLKRQQSAADLSDGTLRFLALLAVLGSPDPPPLIAIDEPDIGLHPTMLPIIAEYAAEAARRKQVIFTTHSPAFLDAFRELTPTITVANSLEGKTHLQVLSGEKLAYWLKEYTLGEIFRIGELEAMEQ